MISISAFSGMRGKIALTALGLSIAAIPMAAALANGDAGAKASLSAAELEAGRQLFADLYCGTCHVFADADGFGQIGPSLDGDIALTREVARDRIANGQGMMPGFAGQMSDAELALLADYLMQAKE